MRKLSTILIMFVFVLFISHAAFGQAKIAPLNIKERTLPNGLRVVSVEDHSSPTVTVQVWYNVGSKDDPERRSGFAHMFEHMMFKSSKNMKSEMLDRLTEDVGGWNNASTSDDFTNYYEVVPSNYLETLLWAEAERMINLNVDEANFKSERDVVKEEFRQGVLAQPYGQFYEYVQQLSYAVHPYRRTTIGNLEELSVASREDADKFYKTFYRPDNATLIVVGDFEQAKLDAWIGRYFGRIQKPGGVIPRVNVTEPQRASEKRFVKTAPNVPLPAVAITYLAPPSKSTDVAALQVAETILSAGESSRLYQSLVYKQQIAQEANFSADIRTDQGLLYFTAILASGKKLEDGEKAILAELKKMQNTSVSTAELNKAKNQLITDSLRQRETNNGKAFQIGQAIIYEGTPQAVNKELDKLRAVTAADVQRVMKKYFTDTNRVVIYYKDEKGEIK